MIIDTNTLNGPIGDNYLFSCSCERRGQIIYTEELYYRKHNKDSYFFCTGCQVNACRTGITPIGHNHDDPAGINQLLCKYRTAKTKRIYKERENVRDFVSLKQRASSSFDLTKRAIQSVTDRLINATLEDNARLLLELDQLGQHILDKTPTSDELAMPNMTVFGSHSSMKEEDMREGLHPEVVKAVLMLTIEENTVVAEDVYFKPNTDVKAPRIGSLIVDLWNLWDVVDRAVICSINTLTPTQNGRHLQMTYSNGFEWKKKCIHWLKRHH